MENKGDDGKRHTNIMSTTLRSITLKATSTWDRNPDKEIQRKFLAGWIAFAKHRDIFKGIIGTCLKRQVYNSCVLPAMSYGPEARFDLSPGPTSIELRE